MVWGRYQAGRWSAAGAAGRYRAPADGGSCCARSKAALCYAWGEAARSCAPVAVSRGRDGHRWLHLFTHLLGMFMRAWHACVDTLSAHGNPRRAHRVHRLAGIGTFPAPSAIDRPPSAPSPRQHNLTRLKTLRPISERGPPSRNPRRSQPDRPSRSVCAMAARRRHAAAEVAL